MKKFAKIAAVLLASLSLAGCAGQGFGGGSGLGGYGTKQIIGGIGGGALGGFGCSFIGSGTLRLAATAFCAVAGTMVGSSIGKSLDEVDQMQAERSAQAAVSSAPGATIRWNNPQSGNYGYTQNMGTGYDTMSNRQCSRYKSTIFVEGQPQTATGIACRNQDGTWQVVNAQQPQAWQMGSTGINYPYPNGQNAYYPNY